MINIVLTHMLEKHLAPFPEARAWLDAYGRLCHAVDDLIDRDNRAVADYTLHTLDSFNLAMDVYSHPFYSKNSAWLYPLLKHNHRVYSDSILWENSPVEWQRHYADVLRCGGNEVILAVLEHICRVPWAELRRISLLQREDCWQRSHTQEGAPI